MSLVYLYALGSVAVVSVIALIGIITLAVNKRLLNGVVFLLVALAVGALLGDAFLHLIPEAFATHGNNFIVPLLVIAGIIGFFAFEKFLHWHHAHNHENETCPTCPPRKHTVKPLGYMILVSDGLHNFLDGIIIAASYFVSIEIGVATTVAVILHEIPQELSDFGVLVHAGFSRMRALLMNFISGLFAVLGAAAVLLFGALTETFVAWIVPVAAGGFIYIAAADLVPELRKTTDAARSIIQIIAVLAGIAAMFLLLFLE